MTNYQEFPSLFSRKTQLFELRLLVICSFFSISASCQAKIHHVLLMNLIRPEILDIVAEECVPGKSIKTRTTGLQIQNQGFIPEPALSLSNARWKITVFLTSVARAPCSPEIFLFNSIMIIAGLFFLSSH